MKKYIFPLAMVVLFIAVISSCAMRHDSCGAYNRSGKTGAHAELNIQH